MALVALVALVAQPTAPLYAEAVGGLAGQIWNFGAGARFGLTDRLSATVDGSRYDLDGTSSTVLSVGLDFGF